MENLHAAADELINIYKGDSEPSLGKELIQLESNQSILKEL